MKRFLLLTACLFACAAQAQVQVQAHAPLGRLRSVWKRDDAAISGGLFHSATDDGSGLPGRRGYYLG